MYVFMYFQFDKDFIDIYTIVSYKVEMTPENVAQTTSAGKSAIVWTFTASSVLFSVSVGDMIEHHLMLLISSYAFNITLYSFRII